MILLLAWVAFELTANASVSTAVSCLELGRTDFRTARWLRRVDPDRRRAWLCSACYLAWGLARVALVAVAVMVLDLILETRLNNGQMPADPPAHFVGAFGILAVSLTIASGLSFGVLLAALAGHTKIWLGPEPRWAMQQGVWPPSAAWMHRFDPNGAKVVFSLGYAFVLFPALIAAIFASFLVPGTIGPWLFLGVALLILVGVVIANTHLERRLLADSPRDCWPLLDGQEPAPIF